MGMFDTIHVTCPYCKLKTEFQTKYGDCTLSNFGENRVPVTLAHNLNGEKEYCEHCKKEFKIYVNTPKYIQIQALEIKEDDE